MHRCAEALGEREYDFLGIEKSLCVWNVEGWAERGWAWMGRERAGALWACGDMELYPKNKKNLVEVLRYRGLALHKELFDCSEEREFEEEAMADGHVWEESSEKDPMQAPFGIKTRIWQKYLLKKEKVDQENNSHF